MMSNHGKIVQWSRSSWITCSDLVMTLLNSRDLHAHADLSTLAAEQEHVDEAEAAFLFEKNISSDI